MWQQQAGFSVFFDTQQAEPDGLRRRIRLYHEETGDEDTITGPEPAGWVQWMLDRLGPARSPSAPAGAVTPAVSIQVELRVTGLAGVLFGPDPR